MTNAIPERDATLIRRATAMLRLAKRTSKADERTRLIREAQALLDQVSGPAAASFRDQIRTKEAT